MDKNRRRPWEKISIRSMFSYFWVLLEKKKNEEFYFGGPGDNFPYTIL